MIVSASRRTDIPALYSDWLMNRLDEGFVLIPNPRNPNRLSRVALSPETVDCFVFWTKNPAPMLDRLDRFDAFGFPYYFQFTLTPYGRDIEPGLPDQNELIRTFSELSDRIGPERVIWRYDPVFIDETHTVSWHIEQFERMCEALHAKTRRCIISFIDIYQNSRKRFRSMTDSEIHQIAAAFSETAGRYGLPLYTCAEKIDLSEYGIAHGACIEREMIEKIIDCPVDVKKDPNQRDACRCIESVDIGTYDTCAHGCVYCYATGSPKNVMNRACAHDPNSPMLTGHPRGDEIVTDRLMKSVRRGQISMFE